MLQRVVANRIACILARRGARRPMTHAPGKYDPRDVRCDRDRRRRDGERDALPPRAERLPSAGPGAVRHPARLRLVARVDAHHSAGVLRGTGVRSAAARRVSYWRELEAVSGRSILQITGGLEVGPEGSWTIEGLAPVVRGAWARVRGARRHGGQSPLPRLSAARRDAGGPSARRRLRPLRGRHRAYPRGAGAGAAPRS